MQALSQHGSGILPRHVKLQDLLSRVPAIPDSAGHACTSFISASRNSFSDDSVSHGPTPDPFAIAVEWHRTENQRYIQPAPPGEDNSFLGGLNLLISQLNTSLGHS
jgi:hypothetical protein